jgi:O-antigen/teichoic acid export membrane protein
MMARSNFLMDFNFIKSGWNRLHRSAAAWSFLATLLRVGANVFVLPIILRKLSPGEFGVWVVFGTIGFLAGLLDLGFEFTVTRMTAYAWAGATRFLAFGIHQGEAADGNRPPNLPLLRDLIATLRAYYLYMGMAVLALLVLGGGAWIWMMTRQMEDASSLRLAWVVYAFSCWLNFVAGRWPALLSGVGAIREAQMAAILSQLCYYGVVIVGFLVFGLDIWALVIGAVVLGFVARSLGRRFFTRRTQLPGGMPRAHFHREIFASIWPNAWRTGLVTIGAFLTTYGNTLICSAVLGRVATGSYGLSFQLVNLLFTLCNVWLTVKLPAINTLRHLGRNHEIVEMFVRRVRLALLCYVVGALVIVFFAPTVLIWLKSKTVMIPLAPLAAFIFFRLLELHHSMYAILVMSENQNPFLKQSLVSGAAIIVLAAIATPLLEHAWGMGLWGMILSMGLVQACYNNWWPVLRGIRGLGLKPGSYFVHYYLRPKAWLELF